MTKKYHIAVLKGIQILYTQSPWPGLGNKVNPKHLLQGRSPWTAPLLRGNRNFRRCSAIFSSRCNSRCVLLRLHDIPDPRWMAGIASGRGPVVWNCNSRGVYIYLIDSNGNSMEPYRSDCFENLRRISAGELGKFDKKGTGI